jgi:hypothetical protein
LGVLESLQGHDHQHIRIAASDVLTLATVALQRSLRLALGGVPDRAAVAATVDGHVESPKRSSDRSNRRFLDDAGMANESELMMPACVACWTGEYPSRL